MPNIQNNKALVNSFFEAWNQRDFNKAIDLLDDNLTWWIIGNAPISGTKDKRSVRIAIKYLPKVFRGFRFELHDFTAEDDRVAVTAESFGEHKSGRKYNNNYHFLFTIRDGKISNVKEYFDTQHSIYIEEG